MITAAVEDHKTKVKSTFLEGIVSSLRRAHILWGKLTSKKDVKMRLFCDFWRQESYPTYLRGFLQKITDFSKIAICPKHWSQKVYIGSWLFRNR